MFTETCRRLSDKTTASIDRSLLSAGACGIRVWTGGDGGAKLAGVNAKELRVLALASIRLDNTHEHVVQVDDLAGGRRSVRRRSVRDLGVYRRD